METKGASFDTSATRYEISTCLFLLYDLNTSICAKSSMFLGPSSFTKGVFANAKHAFLVERFKWDPYPRNKNCDEQKEHS